MNKNYICPHCDSDNLIFSEEAKWSIEQQKFVYDLEKFYFEAEQAFCEVCDNWIQFEIIEES
jgi:hypothetical protein